MNSRAKYKIINNSQIIVHDNNNYVVGYCEINMCQVTQVWYLACYSARLVEGSESTRSRPPTLPHF